MANTVNPNSLKIFMIASRTPLIINMHYRVTQRHDGRALLSRLFSYSICFEGILYMHIPYEYIFRFSIMHCLPRLDNNYFANVTTRRDDIVSIFNEA